ncbi:MAG: DsrE family protein [Anaerolineaceae bacterium]|nr:DsrE family protein [Anaerolineaceae bacterium]
MDKSTVLTFTRNGLGEGPAELQTLLAVKYLSLLFQSNTFPGAILFYTEGVKLVCEGSLVLEPLRQLEEQGVKLLVCLTCLEKFELTAKLKVGSIGGMPNILKAMQQASQVISL